MNVLGFEDSVLASSPVSIDLVTPRTGSKKTSKCTSWHAHGRVLYPLLLVALIAPSTVSALPLRANFDYEYVLDSVSAYSLHRRADSNNNSGGGMSMSIWLPVLAVSIVFMLFSLVICIRRCASPEAVTPSRTSTSAGASATRTGNNGNTRPRRRPRRTPSQISTKSLPPYMKEPGDQELVLFRGPLETEDDHPPPGMPTLAEDDEHPELQDATFNIALNRVESYDTMADASTTNLIRRASAPVPRPPELDNPSGDVARRRSADAHSLGSSAHSRGSSADLLGSHQRTISTDVPDPRGEAPAYSEAVSADPNMTTISLNDPEPSNPASVPRGASSTNADSMTGEHARGGSRSRFSFLLNPFSSSHSVASASLAVPPPPSVPARAASPASIQPRSESALSRVSSNESHISSHSRTRLGNHSRSNSNLLRAFRSNAKLPVSNSTISLDSISAPLTHTVTRSEFHAPKGGLLTAEQIKLITSREALEKFGVPYGPDAVAAASLSREQLGMAPPPDFESVAGEHGQPEASGSGSTGSTSGEGSATVAPSSDALNSEAGRTSDVSASPRALSPASPSHASLSPRSDMRAESRASTVLSYATARESDVDDDQHLYLQAVRAYASDSETDDHRDDAPLTARPVSPTTARPFSLAGDRESVA